MQDQLHPTNGCHKNQPGGFAGAADTGTDWFRGFGSLALAIGWGGILATPLANLSTVAEAEALDADL